MATPTTRNEFKEYCLRALGKGVVKINATDAQIEDRIDEALKYYRDYHFDASDKVYYKHTVEAIDKVNRYITVPDNIIGVTRMFPPNGLNMGSINDPFSLQYQLAMSDFLSSAPMSVVPYYTVRMQIALIEEILVGQKPIRFSRHKNRITVDMDWKTVNEGSFLIFEAEEAIDPDMFSDVWADKWLAMYAEALLKRQWGANMKKFGGIQMLGGTTMNGQTLFDEGNSEVKALQEEMTWTYAEPPEMMIG